jgi:tetratricopeptide (TPR) repeat protein/energy-coupling factor transporter ATP-binding protein EcfA2
MIDRSNRAKEDSDTSYFYDLMLLGESLFKIVVLSLVSSLKEDKDRNKYRLLYRIVRADGMGDWASVLDEVLTGVPSQGLPNTISANEQKELLQKSEEGSWQYDCVYTLANIFESAGLELNPLGARAQARNWFALFVQLRNGTKAHGAIPPSGCSQACKGLEASLTFLIANFHLFKREWAYVHQNLNGKYRVSTLNNGHASFDELKTSAKFANHWLDGVYVQLNERTLVELIHAGPDVGDFYLPNGKFKDKSFELLSYISNQRQNGNSSKYLTPVNELPESETQGHQKLHVIGNCFSNLPPLNKDYISRTDLENNLTQILLEEDRYPIVTLVGRGGIGKTTLALSVLHNLTSSDRFDVVLWFSSRDIDLMLEGPKPVKNSILSEEDLACEFCKLLDTNTSIKKSEKVRFFSQQLTKASSGKILFVLDNFETVHNPRELFSWLDTYIRNPNKILITSRISKTFKADYPIEIQGMTDEECSALIHNTADKLNIQQLLSSDVIEKIIEEAQGHPYVIKILLGQIAKNKKFSDIERIMARQEDILIALFRRTYSDLSMPAQRVFLTLCSWRSVIPKIALEAVLLREENSQRINVEGAIEELKRSSFIDVTYSQGEEYEFVSVPLAASLFGKEQLEVSQMKAAILSDRELLQEFGAIQHSDIQNGILPRIERKFKSIANKISQPEESLSKYLPTLEFLCRSSPAAWKLLSQLHLENGDLSNAQDSLREYLKTDLYNEDRKFALLRLADLYNQTQDWQAELNSLVEVCLLPNTSLEEISDIANIINRYLNSEGNGQKLVLDNDIKESLVKKVAEIFSKRINTSTFVTATDFSRIAWLYIHLRDSDKARDAVEKGLIKDYYNPYCNKLAVSMKMI